MYPEPGSGDLKVELEWLGDNIVGAVAVEAREERLHHGRPPDPCDLQRHHLLRSCRFASGFSRLGVVTRTRCEMDPGS